MNSLAVAMRLWWKRVVRGWDAFWFQPALPHTLAAIRILGGAMLLYTHAVWTIGLEDFLGAKSWLSADMAAHLNRGPAGYNFAWSYLYWVDSPALLWTLHIAALVVFALLTVGFFTRVTAVLAFVVAVSYCHRLNGTLFGLDQVNVFVAMYLMLGDSGGVWSVDRWRAQRRAGGSRGGSLGEVRSQAGAWEREAGGGPALASLAGPTLPAIGTNIAVRLLQIHMCVIYLFGGIGKARGDTWWDGGAMWLAFANLEYQSLDMTWTVHFPWLLALLSHATVFWEISYCFLIWPKLTRPIVLAMAVLVHLGIAVCLGMKTFGLAMIVGNLAFVYPETVRGFVSWLGERWHGKPGEVADDRDRSALRPPLMVAGR